MLCSASLLVQPITAVFCFTVHCGWESTRSPSHVLTYRAWLQCHNYFKLVFLLPYCSIIYIVLFPIDKSYSLFFIVMMWINCCSTVMCLVLQWSHWFQCNSNLLCFCSFPIYTPITNALIFFFSESKIHNALIQLDVNMWSQWDTLFVGARFVRIVSTVSPLCLWPLIPLSTVNMLKWVFYWHFHIRQPHDEPKKRFNPLSSLLCCIYITIIVHR